MIVGDALLYLSPSAGLEMSPAASTPDPALARQSILAITEALPEGTLMLPMHDFSDAGFTREKALEFLHKKK